MVRFLGAAFLAAFLGAALRDAVVVLALIVFLVVAIWLAPKGGSETTPVSITQNDCK